jgi:hypothetical protein
MLRHSGLRRAAAGFFVAALLGAIFVTAAAVPIPTAGNAPLDAVLGEVEQRLPGWQIVRAGESWENNYVVVAVCDEREVGFQVVPARRMAPGDAFIVPDDRFSRSRLRLVADDARHALYATATMRRSNAAHGAGPLGGPLSTAMPRDTRASAGSTLGRDGPALRVARRRPPGLPRCRVSRRAQSHGSMDGSRPLAFHVDASRICRPFADVAQLVEHFTRNEGVAGSSPAVGFARYARALRGSVPRSLSTTAWSSRSPS